MTGDVYISNLESDIASHFLDGKRMGDRDRVETRFEKISRRKDFFFFQIFRSDSKGKSIFYIQSDESNDETRSRIDGDRQISPSSFLSS